MPAVQSVLADRSAVAPLETVVTRPFTDIDSLSSEAPDASHSQADAESGLVTEEHDISSMPVEHATPDENGMVETLERDAEWTALTLESIKTVETEAKISPPTIPRSTDGVSSSSVDSPAQMRQLTVEVVAGRGLKNKDAIGKQDPFCTLQIGDTKARTCTHENGGTAPVWQESFIFEIGPTRNELLIECLEEDSHSHDFIGSATVSIHPGRRVL